jgi:hypothetical protein
MFRKLLGKIRPNEGTSKFFTNHRGKTIALDDHFATFCISPKTTLMTGVLQ